MNKLWVALGLVLVLVSVNFSIYQKEVHIQQGRMVYLELAPVDPRSLMQGDYMALDYAVERQADAWIAQRHDDGINLTDFTHVVVTLDEKNVATFVRFDGVEEGDEVDRSTPLGDGELRMAFFREGGGVRIATDAYFFKEGTAELYEPARFGAFKWVESGELILMGMCDKEFRPLGVFMGSLLGTIIER